MSLIKITHDEIQIEKLLQHVQDRHCGAISLFMGTVREFTAGKRTQHLTYTTYTEMAEKMLAQIAHEAIQQFHVKKVAIIHRVGQLEIGETAVAIAVSAPHRKDAFAGSRHIIEQIKAFVPIWKKEVGERDSYWVGTTEKKR